MSAAVADRRHVPPGRLLTLAAAVSLVLGLATVVAWARSLWRFSDVTRSRVVLGAEGRETGVSAHTEFRLMAGRFRVGQSWYGADDRRPPQPRKVVWSWDDRPRRARGVALGLAWHYRRWEHVRSPLDGLPPEQRRSMQEHIQAFPGMVHFQDKRQRYTEWDFLGFGWRGSEPVSGPGMKEAGWTLIVPCWFVVGVCAVLPARCAVRSRRARRARRRQTAGLCPACGYDLRGSTGGPCPECGTATGGPPGRG